ncbi:hypothetical protein [Paenibacillus sp. CF384]|uniref:hypothetical protein n=1 Tax=Paenibacillus sp. CF384 TaxID=1884382 RepID=UPI0008942EA1|nr:hypothetical protein [Paenibacillus sp. CF384]SDX80097.1 hypothetical protein SAMN05518855_102235 [Paenibacillus sp. CF384]
MGNRMLAVFFALLLVVILGQTFFARNNYNINQFIKEQQIEDPQIVTLKDKSYIFVGSNNIYVFRGKSNYEHYVGNELGNYIIGGMEKGSVAIIIKNIEIAKDIRSYTVIIDGIAEGRKVEFKNGNNIIVVDERIWNPTPNFKIIFYNNVGKDIMSVNH